MAVPALACYASECRFLNQVAPVQIEKEPMYMNQLHYLPVSLPFFSILVAVFILLVVLLQIEVLAYAYWRLGVLRHCDTCAAGFLSGFLF